MSIEEYVTIDDAAKIINVSPLTVRRWINEGYLDEEVHFKKKLMRKQQVENFRAVFKEHPFDWRKHWQK